MIDILGNTFSGIPGVNKSLESFVGYKIDVYPRNMREILISTKNNTFENNYQNTFYSKNI